MERCPGVRLAAPSRSGWVTGAVVDARRWAGQRNADWRKPNCDRLASEIMNEYDEASPELFTRIFAKGFAVRAGLKVQYLKRQGDTCSTRELCRLGATAYSIKLITFAGKMFFDNLSKTRRDILLAKARQFRFSPLYVLKRMCTMRVIFWGTPEFLVPVLGRIGCWPATKIRRRLIVNAPRPAGPWVLKRSSERGAASGRAALWLCCSLPCVVENGRAPAEFRPRLTLMSRLLSPMASFAASGSWMRANPACLNIHGRACIARAGRVLPPIHRAIMAVMKNRRLASWHGRLGLDTGPVLLRAATPNPQY